MAVSVSCPSCSGTSSVSEELLGKKIRCKSCQATFVAAAVKVPAGARAADAEPAPRQLNRNGAATQRAKAPTPAGGGPNKALLFGGGFLVVIVGAVAAWVFMRGGGESADGNKPINSGSSAPKISFNDTVAEAEPPQPKSKDEEPKAKEKPAAVIKSGASGPAWFVNPPVNMPFTIPHDIGERVRRSSAYINAITPSGGGSGSGWMAEPGIVITNSHVVGMKETISPPPTSLKVILYSGTPEKREFDAQLLGLDRENDLAVLKIEGDNLPAPMPIARSSDLVEGQKLYTVGFPKGKGIEKEFSEGKDKLVTRVKLRETTVAARLPNHFGSVKLIQMEGGVDGGNSGGMVVDSAGNVRSVVVSQYPGTNMRFSIPSEYVIHLLRGRALTVVPHQPFNMGDKVRQLFTVSVADPMKRIKSVSLELWTGEPGKRFRPATVTAPSPIHGDSARQTINLPYDANAAVALGSSHELHGECDLPQLPAGQAYWIQPHYVGTDGKERWSEAIALAMSAEPVDRKPAALAMHHQAGTDYSLNLESHYGVGLTPEGGELHMTDQGLMVRLTEKTQSIRPDGKAKILLRYDDLKLTDADMEGFIRSRYRGFLESMKGLTTEMQVDQRGNISSVKPIFDKVPVLVRPQLSRFNVQTLNSLESLALSLPDRELQPDDTWQHDANYCVNIGQLTETTLMHLTYRYVGTRVRDGREEAVIEFSGDIVKGDNAAETPVASADKGKSKSTEDDVVLNTRNLSGKTRGAALVDLRTGLVSLARTNAEMQFDVLYPRMGTVQFGLMMRVDFHRQLQTGGAKPSPTRLLPNLETALDPFVGASNADVTQLPGGSP